MSRYRLCSFDFPGRAQPIRYLLAYAEHNFIDDRINIDAWQKETNTSFVKKTPNLLIDNEKYTNALSICRFLGEKFKLSGNNEMENFQLDCLAEKIVILRDACENNYLEKNSKDQKLSFGFRRDKLYILNHLEDLLRENEGYLALNRLTWPDIFLAASMPYLSYCSEIDLLENRPNLKRLVEKIEEIPGIQKYTYYTNKMKKKLNL